MVDQTTLEPLLARTGAGRSGKTHRSDIDGLRAIAVLAVIGYHCRIPWLQGGFVGVDVFFVISGYLICSIIYKEMREGSFSLARFYERRFKRILPALAVVIFFCLGLAALVLSPWEAYRLGDSAVAASVSGSNFLFIIRTGYFAARALTNPLLMTWSLGVEEQFYIAFPLIMLVLRNKSKRSLVSWLTILSVLSLATSAYAEFRLPVWNFYLPVTRAWELGAGTLLAIWQSGSLRPRTRPSWRTDVIGLVGLLMILGSILFYRPEMRFPGYEAIPPVLGSVLILASPGGRGSRILSMPPLAAVGLISYSLYLWHWPMLSFAEILSSKPLRPQTIAILMTLAFAMAIVSYFCVEKPFRAPNKLKTRRILLSYGALIALILVVGGAYSLTNGLPWRAAKLYEIETRADLFRHHPCISAASYLRMGEQCVPVPETSAPTIAVLGDSHAEAFAEGLKTYVSGKGWQLATITREGCLPTKGFSVWSAADSTLADSCRRFNQTALDYVLGRPDIREVILVGRWQTGLAPDGYMGAPLKQSDRPIAANLKTGLGNEIAALESGGKRVILLEDVPSFPFDPVEGVRDQYMPLRRALNRMLRSDQPEQGDGTSENRSVAVTPADDLASVQLALLEEEDTKLTLVDPKKALCHGDRCYFANGLDLYYFDSTHLSPVGAQQILPLLPGLNASLLK